MTYCQLQNGSDVRGVAIATDKEKVNLTPDGVNDIVQAYVCWLAKEKKLPLEKLRISVGHDSRLSAEALKNGALAAITGLGAQAIDCHLATTPAMFFSLILPEMQCDGAIMLTASHLPFNRNGLKFFTVEGGMEKATLKTILQMADKNTPCQKQEKLISEYNLMDLYAKMLREKIKSACANGDKPLHDLHIVVDAGNGASGFFAKSVLKPLGADIGGSQYLEPDGHFPNHIPNPEDKGAIHALKEAVLTNDADLGIIFDTDGDRMATVLDDGLEVNRNRLIALIAAILAPEYPHSTIVTDSVTNDGLTEFLEKELGLKHFRYKRGYKNVINKCRELNAAGEISPLAIETSGHGALKENYYLDDGAYLAVRLIIAAAARKAKGEHLQDLISRLPVGTVEAEYRIPLKGENFAVYGESVLRAFARQMEALGHEIVTPSYEGVRVAFRGDITGWLLLRQSLHDPVMPLNIEGKRQADCEAILAQAKAVLVGFTRLDTTVLS